ncbi:transcription factor bHLH104-like isoform X2 [Amaranthus tricolor]|uniref:transcription factor bHLH104-like isoform X2 n=1 Tax=Amaranthus tricolor TaxID=29722 RepID=UPI0025828AB2|nr:transcription factor bHLH104-like isoform X2 [Amaranthus tricolor]
MGSFDDSAWDLPLNYFIDDVSSPNFSWVDPSSSINIDFSQTGSMRQELESEGQHPRKSSCIQIDFSKISSVVKEQDCELECSKKRGRATLCSKPKSKAFRERERREKLNDSFLNLSSILEPGRAAKTDKLAILSDAIRVVKQLRIEAEEYKEENKKLQEEIESLKAEKNELRDEKSTLKAEKEKMEQQMKAMAVPGAGMIPPYPPAYQAGPNKMALYPSYGMFPMWHYLPPSTRDTSRDHELRPPAA